jgi:TonB-dependent starch-binding outer membrane protein SusC
MNVKRLFGPLAGLPVVLLLMLAGPAEVTAQQQTGTVEGTVTDGRTGEPLRGAQITVAETTLGALSGANGAFTISNVPVGTQRVQAQFLGFATVSQEVDVSAGDVVRVDFTLTTEAIGLEGIVVTAAGEEVRRRELGNVVGNIQPRETELATVTNFSDLIQGRSAGVTVSSAGGTVGTGSRIRIRGAASVSLSNDPLIIIDGVRADNTSESMTIGVGGQSFSRFEDLNPRDIESIEVLKGPAATAMYGTAAGAGAIQITTRRGVSGDARWTVYTEQGVSEDPHDYPANYNAWWTNPEGAQVLGCNIDFQAQGVCQPDSLAVFNPIEATNLLRTGYNQTYGLNVSGGTSQFTYFLSGDFQDNEGVLENNELNRINLRGNFQAAVREDLDLGIRTGYTTSDAILPQNDNNILGLVSGALLGRAVDDEGSRGWFAGIGPDNLLQFEVGQQVDRFVAGIDGNWRPADWLTLSAVAGMDNVERHDNSFAPPNTIFFGSVLPTGERISNRVAVQSYTSRLTGRTSYSLTPDIEANTGIGGEFTRELFEATLASGSGLLGGTRSLAAASDNFAVDEQFTDIRTIAGWIEQRLAWQDRVYLNLALRADDDNSFGDRLDLIWYPSASLSWVLNEEAWFPQTETLSSVRLRGAVGRAGLRPGFRDALLFFEPQTVNVDGTNEPGFSIGGSGNPDLKPEISTEFEFGFDADLFAERIGMELTYFNKTSRDALVQRRLSPSLGATTTRFENIGEVVNQGFEFSLNALLLDMPNFLWRTTVSGSFTDNELTDLGDVEPIIFGLGGNTQRHQEGFPLGGYWSPRITDVTAPADGGLVTRDNYTVTETEYIGPALPTREIALSMDMTLFQNVAVRAMADHQGGHYLNNSTRFFRCGTTVNCRELYDPESSPQAQAEALAGLDGVRGAFIEKADFIRLREVALTFSLPDRFVQPVGATGLRLTLAGRNLATWTDYTGLDPELNFAGQANFSTADFLTQPPLRHWTARVSVDF